MKKILLASTAIAVSASSAFAGGLERTSQSTAILFEEGRYFETSLSFGDASVSGIANFGGGDVASGDIAKSFFNLGLAYKADINDTWSYAIIYDQPYGAEVFYPSGTPYLFQGSSAKFTSHALTGILQYNVNQNVSVYGGLRAQTIEAEAEILFAGYSVTGDRDLSFGYLVGAAYEKPEIALRVALTYNSAINHDLSTTEVSGLGTNPSVTPVEMPQSVNLEFQSGVNEKTLVFGSVRWVDWSEGNISPTDYATLFAANPDLVRFTDDRTTYTLGVGRKLSETWSVLGSVSYEETTGSITGNLAPLDGFTSVALGAIYTKDNMKVTGGLRYVDIGNANTTANANFDGNSAIGAGIKVGWQF